ncbi:H-type lectin domain-containing protein [Histidinibacterium aquaticum]|uniref:H-type lectin domain-containing protein n=1 Tax=Histidinibacterium aquaticum TaxID=2613962 RepID=A0A5J5GL43_9RHOB|nr:H-type lectin domain-containing protein [Histidinibacterium aquaticum]KAA9008264.1 hypothetical protein F3S47_12305 [Histidinibacterium aquaticum]
MKKLRNHLIGIDSGEEAMFEDFRDGGPMWSGEGPREARREVRFSESYRAPPSVQVALTMWDIAAGANARADVGVEAVTPEGFTIVFRTWGDSRIARVRVGWQAIGELRYSDDWEVD